MKMEQSSPLVLLQNKDFGDRMRLIHSSIYSLQKQPILSIRQGNIRVKRLQQMRSPGVAI